MWQLARVMGLALVCAIILLAAATCGGKKSRTTPSIIPLDRIQEPAASPQDGGSTEPKTDLLMQRLTAALEKALAARGGKAAMVAPTGEGNLIVDLDYVAGGVGGNRLRWHYRNLGDYNQDGIANIADITPLAQHFAQTIADNPLVEVIDGDLDGAAGLGDVEALAMHFQSTVSAYLIESSTSEQGEYGEIGSVEFAAATGGEEGWKDFTFPLPTGEALWYRVVPVDSEGNRGLESLPVRFQSPTASARVVSVSPRWGEPERVTQFTAVVEGEQPISYAWHFGTMGTPSFSAEESPAVYLAELGRHVCHLKVSNAHGEHTFYFAVLVAPAEYPPMIERIWPLQATANTVTQFFAQVSGTEPIEWQWNFGGAATPNESSDAWPRVQVGTEGSYECSLTVTNSAGVDSYGFVLEVMPGARGDWWMFGREPTHNRRSEYAGPVEGGIVWSYQVPSSSPNAITTGAAFDRDGTIYFGCEDGFIYAVYADGSMKWRYETGGPVYSSPAISKDGILYAGSYDGYLYALDPAGNLLWRYETGDQIASSPVISPDGTVYIGGYDHFLYALNPDGTLRWRYEAGDTASSSPAIGDDGTIYVGSHDENLYAIEPDGNLKWSYDTGADVYSSPAIASDGTIYIANDNGYLRALNPDGTRKWYYDTYDTIYSSPAIGSDGTVYFANDSGTIYALGPERDIQWAFPTGGQIRSSLAVDADGTIYAASYDDYLYALNPDGSVRWRCKTDSWYSSIAIGSNGLVYAGSTDGFMYGIGEGASSPYIAGVEPSYIRPGEEAQFSAEVMGTEPFEYSWNFGEGAIPATSSEPSPTVVGGEAWYYDGQLTVTSPYGSHTRSFTYIVTRWSIEVADDGIVADPQPCLAFDRDNRSVISYHYSPESEFFDTSPNGELRLAARGISGWTIETLDTGYFAGYQSSMALSPEGNLAISYLGESTDPERCNLRYAEQNGSSWDLSVVFAEGCSGYFSSLVFDPSGNPTISYSGSGDPPNSTWAPLCFAYRDGSFWQSEVIETPGSSLVFHTSLAYDLQGNPCIAWGEPNDRELFFTRRGAESWTTELVLGSVYCDWRPISLVMDLAGNPLIAFTRSTPPYGLTLARKIADSWQLEDIESDYTFVCGTSMALDDKGDPAIAYLHQAWSVPEDLMFAYWNGSSWNTEFVDTANSWRTSLAFDLEGDPCIAYTDYAETTGVDPVYEVRFARYVP